MLVETLRTGQNAGCWVLDAGCWKGLLAPSAQSPERDRDSKSEWLSLKSIAFRLTTMLDRENG